MKPLLSIITPVYNVEAYLDRCVQSILNQSYHNIELILIDDGSTDGSLAVCEKWAAKDNRVKVIHKENGGVSTARNAGLEVMKGDYLTFVDPDDFISLDTYADNMDYLLKHQDVDILQYPYCNYYSENEISDYHRPSSLLLVGSEQIFQNWWSGSPLEFTACNKIYKRALWNDVRFVVGHVSEDTRLVPQFALKANSVYISSNGLYYYQRNRKDSYTYGDYTFEKHLDLFYAHVAIYECFKMFPNLVTEKVLAFTRLFRRLITAMKTNPNANVKTPLKIVKQNFPTWNEILSSRKTEKRWLFAAKVLGPSFFARAFLKYLNL